MSREEFVMRKRRNDDCPEVLYGPHSCAQCTNKSSKTPRFPCIAPKSKKNSDIKVPFLILAAKAEILSRSNSVRLGKYEQLRNVFYHGIKN